MGPDDPQGQNSCQGEGTYCGEVAQVCRRPGYASAQTNLGVMYYKNRGVLQDNVYAHMWGSIGASNGSENGGKLRDMTAKQMTPAAISTAQKLSRECAKKNYKGCREDLHSLTPHPAYFLSDFPCEKSDRNPLPDPCRACAECGDGLECRSPEGVGCVQNW